MKSRTEATHNLLAAVFMGMSIAISAVAQAPPSSERRKECEGTERFEGKGCANDDAAIGGKFGRRNFPDISMLSGDAESPPTQHTDDLNFLKNAAADLERTSQSDDPDFKTIAIEMAEIRRRAMRIRSSLELPRSAPKGAIRRLELLTDRPQLKLSIQALSALINEAVRSELPPRRVLDVIGSLKARSDLDAIVELSERISKQCELLGQGSEN